MIPRLFCTIIIAVFITPLARAATITLTDDLLKGGTIGKEIEYLEDPTGKLTIDDVTRGSASGSFRQFPEAPPVFGLTSSAHWLRLRVKTDSEKYWFLEVANAMLDRVELYSPAGAGFTVQKAGAALPFNERAFSYRTFVFPLHDAPGSTTRYLHIKSSNAYAAPLHAWSGEDLVRHINADTLFLGMYLGILLIMFFYNTIIFFTVRESSYGYLSLTILVIFLWRLTFSGEGFQHLWPSHPNVNSSLFVYPPLVATVFIPFVRSFLLTKIHTPRIDRVLIGMLSVSTIGILLGVILATPYYNFFVKIILMPMGTIFFILAIISSGMALKQGNRSGLFFLVAFALQSPAAVLNHWAISGFIESNFLTIHGGKIGTVWLITLLSLGLADRIRTLNIRLKDLTGTLEEKVVDRTVELARTNELLTDANAQKSRFFMNLSHEIRTPLTIISNYIDRHIETHGSGEEILIIKRNIDSLTRDMVNFFDILRFERGVMIYDHSRIIDLSAIMSRKVDAFTSLAYRRDISIASDIEEGLHVKADPLAIERIVNNLMDNAIRYNRNSGTIEVALKSSGPEVTLVVRDSGIGIDGDQKIAIFEPYFQLSREKMGLQGIGMGLAVVKDTVESLGGTITVDSEPGVFTAFTVSLKRYHLREGDSVSDEATAEWAIIPQRDRGDVEPGDDAGNSIYSVMVVEDNPELATLMKKGLSPRFRVTTAVHGRDALEKLGTIAPPDVIVSDIMMDVMDGYDFFEEIQSCEETANIPFIFVTAKSGPDDRIEGLKRGAIAYINKPFPMQELASKIDAILRYSEKYRKASEKERFASLGMLLGGIAHEIFNPLSGITGPLENIKRELKKDGITPRSPYDKYLRQIGESVEKIERTVNTVRVLYSERSLDMEYLDIGKEARLIAKEFSSHQKSNFVCAVETEPGISILGNRDAFREILNNLIENAVAAMNSGDTVIISARTEKGHPVVTVSDTGRGIPGEHLASIFHPFFTTGQAGTGLGLGLSIVKNLCLKMGWKIDASSEPGKGTTFTITADIR